MRSLFFVLLCAVSATGIAATSQQRVIQFSYQILAAEFPAGLDVDIFVPLPGEAAGQRILAESLQASHPGTRGSEPAYGNAYYRIHRPAGSNEPITANLSWTVARDEVTASGASELSMAQRAQYLGPNARVPVGHEILEPILSEIHQLRRDDSPASTARAIYDWVVDNVEYKKVGTGWGNGDTFWACNERYGNCTDFHALFISLARSEGIPARFEIGFPVPLDRDQGEIGGYHCWVQFYLPEQGWVPIDASEASKHPQQRELLYGSHPADRIYFTTGRDLQLSPASITAPLNYFIYPYVEVGGVPWTEKVPTRFSYKDVAAS